MFEFDYNDDGVSLIARPQKVGFIRKLFSKTADASLDQLVREDQTVAFAVADLQALADTLPGSLQMVADGLRLSHRLASSLDVNAADALGLPPVVDLILKTDVEGIVGSPSFQLRHVWMKNGQRQLPRRVGCILETAAGLRRIPLWMMEAVEISEGFSQRGDDASDWEALARFRQALDPGVSTNHGSVVGRMSMTDFLSGLEVKLADRFSLSLDEAGTDFEVVPFSGDTLYADSMIGDDTSISERSSELQGDSLRVFQNRVRQRGAIPAYRLSPGKYLVVDGGALPALRVMAEMQHTSEIDRAAFIQNPRERISTAIQEYLRDAGRLDGLEPSEEEEAIETAAMPVFIETREFSERVTGITVFQKPTLDQGADSGTTWLPEDFGQLVAEALDNSTSEDLRSLQVQIQSAIEAGIETVPFQGIELPARPEMSRMIQERLAMADDAEQALNEEPNDAAVGPLVLKTEVNFDALRWQSKISQRHAAISSTELPSLMTKLMSHQKECIDWEISAWQAGLPGILNADEQGLGKTLETIAFLAWLNANAAHLPRKRSGPILVVAPTSLLENWEQEVRRHLSDPGLGHLIRLYGSSLGGRKIFGATGRDTDSGEAKLDFKALHEAIEDGRAHRFDVAPVFRSP